MKLAPIAILFLLCATPALANSDGALATVVLHAPARLKVNSPQFTAGGRIALEYSAYGANQSPGLAWSGAPASTRAFAVLTEDPDASGAKPFVHWVVYDIPATARGFAAGALPPGARPGVNGSGKAGYHGPHPPADGDHHYHFEVFALDRPLAAAGAVDRDALVAAMKGHVVAAGDLVGLFRKP